VTGFRARAIRVRLTPIVAVLAIASGALAATAALAPNAVAGPATLSRLDLISGKLIAPATQSATYQDDAEPGDAAQLVFYATGACTPQAGNANCDPSNGGGQGVAGDGGAVLANTSVTVSIDQGFFTPNCSSTPTNDPNALTGNFYADCTFATTPTAGALVGNLADSGTSETVTTNSEGEFVVTIGIGRDTSFDEFGTADSTVTADGLASVGPGDRASGVSCLPGVLEPFLTSLATPPGPPGCPVSVEWTTEEQPLNGGTAHLTSVPAIATSPGDYIPTANNVAATDVVGGTSVPDVDRVDFVAQLTDQFGNPTGDDGGSDLPSLTKSGPGSLYECTGSSPQSACTGGALAGTGTTTQIDSTVYGSYLGAGSQHVFQVDTNNGTINLRYPCNQSDGACTAANTATPGVNDGSQTDTLAWSAPTTTFASFISGSPSIGVYVAGAAAQQSDTYILNFYDQQTSPTITDSVQPGSTVATSSTATMSVTLTDSHGYPIFGQYVVFSRSGSNVSSCSPPTGYYTGNDGMASYPISCSTAGTVLVTATVYDPTEMNVIATRSVNVTFSAAGDLGAPTGVIASPSDHGAVVLWTAPTSTGGSPIAGYDVQYSTNGGSTWTSASSAFHSSTATNQTVSGLTNGTSYIFRIAAINAGGTGPYSSPSSSITVGTVPGAPTNVTATAGNAQATIAWTAPSSNGGAPITGYDVQFSSNAGVSWTSASSGFHTSTAASQTVTGLANGTSYVFRVAAINAVGTGAYSAPSAPVTPPGTPGAPTGVAAIPGDASANVTWTAPTNSGGSPITSYVVQDSTDGGGTWTPAVRSAAAAIAHDSPATTETVTGLTNGTAYVFRVAANSTTGTGAYSTASAPVTPTGDQAALTIGGTHLVTAGTPIILTTKLSDTTTHSPIGSATVSLLARPAGSSGWTALRTSTTGTNGTTDVQVKSSANTRYEWSFSGDTMHSSATSPVLAVSVRPNVTATLTKSRAQAGTKVQLYGVVTPDLPGTQVIVQRRSQGEWVNTQLRATTHAQRLPNGRTVVGYVLTLPTGKTGAFTYRIDCRPSNSNVEGFSTAVILHVT
jgi:titin